MISVIMPSYNRAHLLERAVASLRAQTWQDWELVLVDDGSTDDTRSVAARLVTLDSRIHVIHQENTGLSGARNAGMALAAGQLITFLDSDDEYLPGHLAPRAEYMATHPEVDLVHGGLVIVGGPEEVPDRTRPGRMIAIRDCYVGGTFFMRRHVPAALGGFRKPDFGDDYDFMVRALGRFRVEKVQWPTYVYHRDTPDSMCNLAARETPGA